MPGLAHPTGGSTSPGFGESRREPPGFPGLSDYEIPAFEQALAPAIEQIDEAESKPSLTTVDSMLAAVTHTGVSRDAGSVTVESAGSTVLQFSRPAGGVLPASRIVA